MKKYFLIAAVLGVFAFASVSFLAQAQDQGAAAERNVMPAPAAADPSDGEAAADEAASEDTAPAPTHVVPRDERLENDHAECTEKAEATTGDAGGPTEEQIKKAYTECMRKKLHTADEIKKIEEGDEGTVE